MKYPIPFHLFLRILLTSFFVLPLLFPAPDSGLQEYGTTLIACSAFLFLYPLELESVSLSLVWASVLFALMILASWLTIPEYPISLVALPIYLFARAIIRHSNRKYLFSGRTVMDYFLSQVLSFHVMCYLLISCLFLSSGNSVVWNLVLMSALAVEDILMLLRMWTGKTLFLLSNIEKSIRKSSYVRSDLQIQPCTDPRMNGLYERIQTVMNDKKPYLEESLDLTELSRMVGTNTTYLSKTINSCYGQNFNRYVNSYRIKYALELLKADSRLKMKDVYVMAGFHSQVSFDMAFKAETGMTPKEYARSISGSPR